jgi:hypothetical protein
MLEQAQLVVVEDRPLTHPVSGSVVSLDRFALHKPAARCFQHRICALARSSEYES